jgi:hypothetical protein
MLVAEKLRIENDLFPFQRKGVGMRSTASKNKLHTLNKRIFKED